MAGHILERFSVKLPNCFVGPATVFHHPHEVDEMRKLDLVGQKIGHFLVLREGEPYRSPPGKLYRRFLCRCDCGHESLVLVSRLGGIKSGARPRLGCRHCGPVMGAKNRIERSRHGGVSGGRAAPIYRVWASMRDRCYCTSSHSYPWYGARGITICDAWQSFPAFRDWAMASGYQEGLTIERIDRNGHYEPGNCEWITRAENARRARQ